MEYNAFWALSNLGKMLKITDKKPTNSFKIIKYYENNQI